MRLIACCFIFVCGSAALGDIQSQLDVPYAQYGARKVRLDLFSPADLQTPRPAVVVVHGGGWLKGDKTKLRSIAQRLARRGYVTVAIEYRLGGEARFPAAVHDCMAAVRWLRANHRRLMVDPKRIAAVGGSAGGHLVGLMATASHIGKLQGRGGNSQQSSAIQAAVVMAGPMVLDRGPVARKSRKQPEKSNANKWFGKTVDEAAGLYRLASPETHVSRQTPPILFQTGELDQPGRNDSMRRKLRQHKVATGLRVYKGGKHGCWNQKSYQRLFVDDIDIFLRDVLRFDSGAFAIRKTKWGQVEYFRDRVEMVLQRAAEQSQVSIARLNSRTKRVYPRANPQQKLALRPGVKRWFVRLPKKLNRKGTRIVVETIGQPVMERRDMVVTARPNGEVVLPAHQATVFGKLLRYEPQPHKNTIGYWANPHDYCRWHFYVDRPGIYDVVVFQGCGKGHGGSEVAVTVGRQRLKFVVEDTGHFQNFKDRVIGQVKFTKPTTTRLTITPIKKAKVAVMDVRRVRLVPRNAGSKGRP